MKPPFKTKRSNNYNMAKRKKESFEGNLERLEQLAEEVEDASTPLDEAIALYKEGIELAAKCGETLKQYEAEVLTLKKQSDEMFKLTPFSGEA